jgi:hypothetical protein
VPWISSTSSSTRAAGPDITLTGTDYKDVLFATGHNDTLTGSYNFDAFVFTPDAPGQGSHDTITDFLPGLEKIHLDGFFDGPDDVAFTALLDELHQASNEAHDINLGNNQVITLAGVQVNLLQAYDFVVHPQQRADRPAKPSVALPDDGLTGLYFLLGRILSPLVRGRHRGDSVGGAGGGACGFGLINRTPRGASGPRIRALRSVSWEPADDRRTSSPARNRDPSVWGRAPRKSPR